MIQIILETVVDIYCFSQYIIWCVTNIKELTNGFGLSAFGLIYLMATSLGVI